MNDNDLREMFRRRETDVLAPAGAAKPVVRKTRLRQLGWISGTAILVTVLIVGSVVGLGSLRKGPDRRTVVGGAVHASETTFAATLPLARIVFPQGWFLLDTSATTGPTSPGPVLQLSNFDPGVDNSPLCSAEALFLPADGVLVNVQALGPALPDSSPWQPDVATPGDCGGVQADRGVSGASGGIVYGATVVAGPDATTGDLAAANAAVDGLAFVAAGLPQIYSVAGADAGPRAILAAGSLGGVDWLLEAYHENGHVSLGVASTSKGSVGAMELGTGTDVHPQGVDGTVQFLWTGEGSTIQTLGLVAFGTASSDVATAEAIGTDGVHTPATITAMPTSLGWPDRVVWASLPGETQYAGIQGYDASGAVIGAPVTYSIGKPETFASGDDPTYGPWTMTVQEMSYGAEVMLNFERSGGGGGSINPIREGEVFGGGGTASGISGPITVTAEVAPSVAHVDLVLADGSTHPAQLFDVPPGYVGPIQEALVILPGTGNANAGSQLDGQLVAYDAQGVELGRSAVGAAANREPVGPTPQIDAVWNDLRTARDELSSWAGRHLDGLGQLNAQLAESLVPALTFNDGTTAVPGEIGVRDVGTDRFVLVSTTPSSDHTYCIGVRIDSGGGGNFTYGNVDATTYASCVGGWPGGATPSP